MRQARLFVPDFEGFFNAMVTIRILFSMKLNIMIGILEGYVIWKVTTISVNESIYYY